MTPDLMDLCRPTPFLDSEHPRVQAFAEHATRGASSAVDRAVRLYYAVRDDIFYEVYGADMSESGLRASAIITRGSGFCVHKCIAYAAAARAVGLPSRLLYADVRNHLASDRLKELVGGDVFRFHSVVAVHLDGRWVKATPVFNHLLCRLYGIKSLDFDGREDSMLHPYDDRGDQHMEFLRWHGEFDDFPYELVVDGLRDAHPRLFETPEKITPGSLLTDAQRGTP